MQLSIALASCDAFEQTMTKEESVMRSKASIAGHPLHPMLVAIPVGLFVWALIADIVYLATDKDRTWYDISYWAGIAAWITALVAALPGLVDLLTVALKSDARTMAVAHMLLNVTVVALYVVAMLLMRDAGALTGNDLTAVVVLHAAGVGMLLLSGWLGGEMVFRHHLGMVPDTSDLEVEEHQQHERHGISGRAA
jgi:uncharacterized membrane protein